MFLNGSTPASVSFIFGLFKQTIQFYNKINVKNVMYIQYTQTHDLSYMSRLP